MYTVEIVKDRFWIVEDAGIKLGLIRKTQSSDFAMCCALRLDQNAQATVAGGQVDFRHGSTPNGHPPADAHEVLYARSDMRAPSITSAQRSYPLPLTLPRLPSLALAGNATLRART